MPDTLDSDRQQTLCLVFRHNVNVNSRGLEQDTGSCLDRAATCTRHHFYVERGFLLIVQDCVTSFVSLSVLGFDRSSRSGNLRLSVFCKFSQLSLTLFLLEPKIMRLVDPMTSALNFFS